MSIGVFSTFASLVPTSSALTDESARYCASLDPKRGMCIWGTCLGSQIATLSPSEGGYGQKESRPETPFTTPTAGTPSAAAICSAIVSFETTAAHEAANWAKSARELCRGASTASKPGGNSSASFFQRRRGQRRVQCDAPLKNRTLFVLLGRSAISKSRSTSHVSPVIAAVIERFLKNTKGSRPASTNRMNRAIREASPFATEIVAGAIPNINSSRRVSGNAQGEITSSNPRAARIPLSLLCSAATRRCQTQYGKTFSRPFRKRSSLFSTQIHSSAQSESNFSAKSRHAGLPRTVKCVLRYFALWRINLRQLRQRI